MKWTTFHIQPVRNNVELYVWRQNMLLKKYIKLAHSIAQSMRCIEFSYIAMPRSRFCVRNKHAFYGETFNISTFTPNDYVLCISYACDWLQAIEVSSLHVICEREPAEQFSVGGTDAGGEVGGLQLRKGRRAIWGIKIFWSNSSRHYKSQM